MRRSRARTGAAAAYDPTLGAIVMFGGYGTAGALNDTWLWRNGAWAALPFQTGPSARGGAGLAWDGSELLLFGGDTELCSDKVLADTWRLVGATWEPAQPAVSPPARTVGHGMAYDGTEVVMFGGWNPNAGTGYGGTFDDTWVYQSATSTWRELTPSPHPSARRAVLAEQSDGSGLLLVGGGGSFQMSDTWTFNAGRWQQLAPNCAGGICSFTSNGGVTFPDRNDDVLYDADTCMAQRTMARRRGRPHTGAADWGCGSLRYSRRHRCAVRRTEHERHTLSRHLCLGWPCGHQRATTVDSQRITQQLVTRSKSTAT